MTTEGDRMATSAPPDPGRAAAPGATTEGIDDAELERPPDADAKLSRLERSGAGPAAGEEDVVRVETVVQHEGDDDVTRHPTLRGSRQQPPA